MIKVSSTYMQLFRITHRHMEIFANVHIQRKPVELRILWNYYFIELLLIFCFGVN